jgi:hypothetical protein
MLICFISKRFLGSIMGSYPSLLLCPALPFKVCKPPISNEMSSRGFGEKFLDLQN